MLNRWNNGSHRVFVMTHGSNALQILNVPDGKSTIEAATPNLELIHFDQTHHSAVVLREALDVVHMISMPDTYF